jgi:bifunctional non-homologous end joining protein LigD
MVARHGSQHEHPSTPLRARPAGKRPATEHIELPSGVAQLELEIGDRRVKLTNLEKLFWPEEKITKRDLLQYYADISPQLLAHIVDRPMTMKRYPNGAFGDFFFMKRAPHPRPPWLEICSVKHPSGNVVDYPLIQDLAALLWVVNLGCIDLNPAYGTCGDIDHPDSLHFDLDPVPGATFETVLDAALLLREALDALHIPSYAKTTGSRGIHVYVPIEKGPSQHEVWQFSKSFAYAVEKRAPGLVTTVYKVAARPRGRVLIDFNQNAWGRTLASVYSVRPRPMAPVSMPVTWQEIERGIRIEQFRMENARVRVREKGDLWAPMISGEHRLDLGRFK